MIKKLQIKLLMRLYGQIRFISGMLYKDDNPDFNLIIRYDYYSAKIWNQLVKKLS